MLLFSASAFAGEGVPAPLWRGSCAEYYSQLPDFFRHEDLAYLPPPIEAEVVAAGKLLRHDALNSHSKLPTFRPELKPIIDKLQNMRRLRVQKAIDLRAERRRLKEQVLMMRSRGRMNSEATSKMVARFEEIEAALGANSDELERIGRTITPLRKSFGSGAILEAARRSSKARDMPMILHEVAPAAAGQFTHKGIGKSISFKFNSATDGVIAGLVPYDQTLSAKVKAAGPAVVAKKQAEVELAIEEGLIEKRKSTVGSLVAVKRDGTTIWVDEDKVKVLDEDIAWVLEAKNATPEGENRLIVSDVDAGAFGYRKGTKGPDDELISHPRLGILSKREKLAIAEFNDSMNEILGKEIDPSSFMTHGAETRNPVSDGPTGYPMTGVLPDGTVRVIEKAAGPDPHKNYKAFLSEADAKGYHIPVNPLWGWH